jgi:hypothetical protein
MSTLNGQNNEHDQKLLHAIEQIVQGEAHTTHEPHSALGVGARLAGTMPQPDAAFADRLEARLVTATEQRKEATMNVIESQRKSNAQIGSTSTKRRRTDPTLRIAAVCLVALVLLLGLVAAAPPVRAAVESLLQRYGIAGIDPNAPTPESSAGVFGMAEPYIPQKLSLAQAQQQVPFPIHLPSWLPEELQLEGIDISEGGWGCNTPEECANLKPPIRVVARYRSISNADANLTIEITQVTPEGGGGYAVADSAIQAVQVNGQPAVYARGSWEQKQPGNARDLQWSDTADSNMLAWIDHDLPYTLTAYNLGLTHEDVIRIAESLQTGG